MGAMASLLHPSRMRSRSVDAPPLRLRIQAAIIKLAALRFPVREGKRKALSQNSFHTSLSAVAGTLRRGAAGGAPAGH